MLLIAENTTLYTKVNVFFIKLEHGKPSWELPANDLWPCSPWSISVYISSRHKHCVWSHWGREIQHLMENEREIESLISICKVGRAHCKVSLTRWFFSMHHCAEKRSFTAKAFHCQRPLYPLRLGGEREPLKLICCVTKGAILATRQYCASLLSLCYSKKRFIC